MFIGDISPKFCLRTSSFPIGSLAKLLISISPFTKLLYFFKIVKRIFKGREENVKFVYDPLICFDILLVHRYLV
jgi:hypothetical protein